MKQPKIVKIKGYSLGEALSERRSRKMGRRFLRGLKQLVRWSFYSAVGLMGMCMLAMIGWAVFVLVKEFISHPAEGVVTALSLVVIGFIFKWLVELLRWAGIQIDQ